MNVVAKGVEIAKDMVVESNDNKQPSVDDATKIDAKVDTEIDAKLDAKQILLETKKELETLKTTIKQDDKESIDSAKEYIQSLFETIKTLDGSREDLVAAIETTIATENYDGKIAIEQLLTIINDLESRADQLSQTDKEKIIDEKKGIQSSKLHLDQLKNAITDPKKILLDTKKEALTTLRDELEKKRWCPKWLSDKVYEFLVAKYVDGKEQKIGQKILGGIMISVLGITMGKNWQSFFDNIDNLSFENIQGVLGAGADKVKNVRENVEKFTQELSGQDKLDGVGEKAKEVKKLTEDEVEKGKEGLRNSLSKMVENAKGVIPTREQLDRVIARIDVSENTKHMEKIYRHFGSKERGSEDANLIDGAFEAIGLPFVFFYQMINALQAEGLIETKDIVFSMGEGVVTYGIKGFKLFGAGVGMLFGKVSWSELGDQIGTLYGKAPDEAKQVLYALVYKTSHNPIFRGMLNLGEYAGNMINTLMFDTGSKIQSLKNIGDIHNKNLTLALKDIDDLLGKVPEGDSVVKTIKQSVNQLHALDDLIKLDLPDSFAKGSDFMDFIRRNNIDINKLPQGLQDLAKNADEPINMSKKAFQKAIATEIGGIAGKAKTELGQLGFFKKIQRNVVGFVAGEKNVYNVIDDAARYLDDVGQSRKNVVGKGKITGAFSRLKLAQKVMKGPDGIGRLAFQADTVKDIEGLAGDFKYLAKQAPSTLKTLIGKTPIFLVGGLALSKDGTPTEKMKNLLKDMLGLIPFVGPIWFIARDGANLNDMKFGQIATGLVLAGVDTWYVGKIVFGAGTGAQRAAKIGKYVVQPFVDVYELGKLGVINAQRGAILTSNIAGVIKNKGFIGTLEGAGKYLWGKKGKFALAAALVGLGWYGFEQFFGGLDDETKAKLAEYEKDPNKLDSEVLKEWPKLPQEERNDYIKAAVLARGGFQPNNIGDLDVKFDTASKKYTIVLPEVINGAQKDLVKNIVIDALGRLQPDSSVDMQLSAQAIVEYRHQLNELYKDTPEPEKTALKKEYIQSMGYNADAILAA